LPGRRITADAGGLLHHHFTLTSCEAVCFCGPIRQVFPPRTLSDIVLCGVRTFLDGVAAAAIPQPTWGKVMIPALVGFVNSDKRSAWLDSI